MVFQDCLYVLPHRHDSAEEGRVLEAPGAHPRRTTLLVDPKPSWDPAPTGWLHRPGRCSNHSNSYTTLPSGDNKRCPLPEGGDYRQICISPSDVVTNSMVKRLGVYPTNKADTARSACYTHTLLVSTSGRCLNSVGTPDRQLPLIVPNARI